MATRFASRELVTLARIAAGRMMIYLGDVAEGMALLDESMVSIEAGELSTVATGDAYCTVIDACSELSDVVRCRAWTTSMPRWCDAQQELVLYRGHCFIHRAEVLGVLGRWREAVVEAQRACDRLARTGPVGPRRGGRASRATSSGSLGDHDAAEAAYLRANELGHDPQPGLALLRLAQGDADGADSMVRRALAQTEDPIVARPAARSVVEIVLAAGDIDARPVRGEELRVDRGRARLRDARREAARAVGAVHLAAATPDGALLELRRAFVVVP